MRRIFPLITIFSLVLVSSAWAYEMSSPSYRIQDSSINVGGRSDWQTSTNYKMRETIGEIGTGLATSSSYKLFGGYQQMQEVYIAVSLSPTFVSMSPDIGGVSGGMSEGLATITVITDSPSGYSLIIKANNSPALIATSSYSFADYTPSVAGIPDYSWSVPATASEFGFTPEGSDIVQKFLDNGSSCNTGSNETPDACWYNFSISDETIAQSYSANHPNGTQTTIKFRAESGSQHLQVAGNYQATIIMTVIPN